MKKEINVKEQLLAMAMKHKKYIFTAVIALFIGSTVGPSSSDLEAANEKTEEVEAKLVEAENRNEILDLENETLQEKLNEAAIWFKMTDEQKKKAEDEVIAAEEKAKAEAQAKKEAEEKAKAEEEAKKKAEEEKKKAEAEALVKAEAERQAKIDAATMSQQQAIKKAESYLNIAGFSRKGLIEQLVFEGFSNADATFAVDVIEVDWNKQAVIKAQSYLDMSSFSRNGLIEQLVFEGFTNEQASYAVGQVGF